MDFDSKWYSPKSMIVHETKIRWFQFPNTHKDVLLLEMVFTFDVLNVNIH